MRGETEGGMDSVRNAPSQHATTGFSPRNVEDGRTQRAANLRPLMTDDDTIGPSTSGTARLADDTARAFPSHDRAMAQSFLETLDPNAGEFTFQLFADHGSGPPKILHCSLSQLWPVVQ